MSSGGGTNTVTQKADPWGPTQTPFKRTIRTAGNLFNDDGFVPDVYQGSRVHGFGQTSHDGQSMMMDAAMAPSATSAARSRLVQLMDPSYASDQLDSLKENVLGTAVPAATAAFSGAGMLNSSTAADYVGRAAAEAIAPFEYGAFNNAQSRALSAAGMAPEIDRATYLPGTVVSGIGAARDAMGQAEIDAQMGKFYEEANPELKNLTGFADFLLPISGQGGSSTSTQPGPSTLQQLGGSAMTGLGTYGALMGTPLAPYAAPVALGSALMGMF